MQELVQKAQARGAGLAPARVILGVISVVVALVAIFPLSAWVEAAEWHHAMQHVLIFSAGLGLGITAFGRRAQKGQKS